MWTVVPGGTAAGTFQLTHSDGSICFWEIELVNVVECFKGCAAAAAAAALIKLPSVSAKAERGALMVSSGLPQRKAQSSRNRGGGVGVCRGGGGELMALANVGSQ